MLLVVRAYGCVLFVLTSECNPDKGVDQGGKVLLLETQHLLVVLGIQRSLFVNDDIVTRVLALEKSMVLFVDALLGVLGSVRSVLKLWFRHGEM